MNFLRAGQRGGDACDRACHNHAVIISRRYQR